MYFVEQRQPLARYVNEKVWEQDRQKPPVIFVKKFKEMVGDCQLAAKPLFHVGFILGCTYLLFPGVTNLCAVTFLRPDGPWFQIFWITLFNGCDTVGRFLGGQPRFFIPKQLCYCLSWLRSIQIFIFIFLAFYPEIVDLDNRFGDFVKILNCALLAFGNGFL